MKWSTEVVWSDAVPERAASYKPDTILLHTQTVREVALDFGHHFWLFIEDRWGLFQHMTFHQITNFRLLGRRNENFPKSF